MASSSSFKLKTSYVVVTIGVLFLLAPIGNFFLPLIFLSYNDWYLPSTWLALLGKAGFLDYALQLLIAVVGLAILLKHKWSWTLAIAILIIITFKGIYNFGNAFNRGITPHPLNYIFLLSTLSVIVLLFYFRYPYLDRRESIFAGLTRRYSVKKTVKLRLIDEIEGLLDNVSAKGFFMQLTPEQLVKLGSGNKGVLYLENMELPFILLRISQDGLAGRFDFPDKNLKKTFRTWLKTLQLNDKAQQ